ncbi:MerR family transcriptional regulator [Pigmentiphaga aceris]
MAWIEFLLRLRTTHMPIGKMQTFAALRGAGDATVPGRRQMLQEHLTEVLADIDAMKLAAEALQAKIEHYRSVEQSLASELFSEEGHADEHQPVEHGSIEHQPIPKPLRTRAGKAAGDRRQGR